ncbi:hypothetical protein RRG08_010594 [Elysia crispata]|uniref:Uncharacterized protein n=1 Tax=Elysia crispata TaxID=231223 RepID=A0AAE1A2X4_9GAST|nr:hypothetical protein RRG08_010594 [Elysia crispata]
MHAAPKNLRKILTPARSLCTRSSIEVTTSKTSVTAMSDRNFPSPPVKKPGEASESCAVQIEDIGQHVQCPDRGYRSTLNTVCALRVEQPNPLDRALYCSTSSSGNFRMQTGQVENLATNCKKRAPPLAASFI